MNPSDKNQAVAAQVELQAVKGQRNQAMDICAKQHAQLVVANQEIARLTALVPSKEKNRAKKG